MTEPAWLFRFLPLGVVGLLAWSVRARNIVEDQTGDQRQLLNVLPVIVAMALSIGVVIIAWKSARRGAPTAGERLFVIGTAGVSTLWWAIRAMVIMSNDHSVGFTVVHLLIAGATIAASVWAVSGLRSAKPALAT